MRLTPTDSNAWRDPATYWVELDAATTELDPPFGVISLPALAHNAHDMLRRAAGKPIRVASKSLRVRSVIESTLELPGYAGVLAYTLPEALWLAETIDDVVVGYPTADREAIRALASNQRSAERVTIMVDSVEQLDFVDAAVAPREREPIRVCIELDSAFLSPILGRIGVLRSPVRTPEDAIALARTIIERPGFTLVGIMSYESQIAGVGNRPPGRPFRARIIDGMQRRSFAEILERRAAVVAAVRELTNLEFVNGGGTGSLERTASDDSVTEIAAGSGLFGPHLFDTYSHFSPAPAAAFALSVVRKPSPEVATILGGGWVASGPPGPDRLPQLAWPEGLEFAPLEMAGEVQSPVVNGKTGAAASTLEVGDRVWLRHTKAGELSEHLNAFSIVDGGSIIDTVPTYRGEGKAFL